MVLSNLWLWLLSMVVDDDDEGGVRTIEEETLSSLSDDVMARRPFLADVAGCIIVDSISSKAANP